MPAYVIADIDVHDPDTYKEYTALVQATLDPFGGRFLVRGVLLVGVRVVDVYVGDHVGGHIGCFPFCLPVSACRIRQAPAYARAGACLVWVRRQVI